MAGTTYKKLAAVHNAAEVAAGADILAAVEVQTTGILTIFVALDTSTVVQLGVSDGSTTEVFDLNAGTALTAATGYAFSWLALPNYSYSLVNKTGETASTVQHASMVLETPVG